MTDEHAPLLRIVHGTATDEEIAALVTVLAARASAAATRRPEAPRSQWANRGRNVRPPLSAGPGAWRASGLPR